MSEGTPSEAIDYSFAPEGVCRRPGITLPASAWTGNRATQISHKKFKPMREAAHELCVVCPVQWECTRAALLSGDNWTMSGTWPSGRRTILAEENWPELLDLAEATGTVVRDLAAILDKKQKAERSSKASHA